MEIRSGYKQTEIGAIPGDWKVAKLQQVCRETITYGIVQCGPHIENGVPYIRVSDMDAREFDVNGMLRTSPAIASRFVRSTVEEGDIVYALRGKLGEVRQITGVVAGANLTQGTARLSPNNQTISSAYLLWAMRSLRALRQAELQAKGTTFREITLADLRQIAIPIPSLGEQRAIAAALSDVDDLINALDQLVDKKRDIKQAAMHQLLPGKQRLPGFHGEWLVRRLGDVFDVAAGGDFDVSRSSLIQDERYPYPIYSNSVSALGFYGYCTYSDHQPNSITVTARGTLGVANYRDHKYTAIGRVLVLQPKENVDGRFFAEFINNRISFVVESTGVPQLTAPQISNYKLRVPPFPEQTAIATILSDMDAERGALEARRDKTRALKQGMMQELLTGKTRLV